MPREKESYRDALEDVLTFFSGKRMLTVSDVCRYTRLDCKTVKSRFEFQQGYISAIVLAKRMS